MFARRSLHVMVVTRPFRCLLIAVAGLIGCSSEVKPPQRPSKVPPTAVWAGGVDGGAFVDCAVRPDGLNGCIVYYDSTGEIWMSGVFELKGAGKGATQSELRYAFADGHGIGLLGGGYLVPHISSGPEGEPVGDGDVGFPLRGFVGYTNTGEPVKDMLIECYASGWSKPVASTTSDASGLFSLPGLPEGTYNLKASKPGWATIKVVVNVTRKSKNFLDLVEELE